MKRTAFTISATVVLTGLILKGLWLGINADIDRKAEEYALLPESQEFPIMAMSWKKWVSHNTPNRNVFGTTSISAKGYPNISHWRPEDFLPDTFFTEQHRDICELDKDVRRDLRSSYRRDNIYELLALAEQGYAEAQSALGAYCNDNEPQTITDSEGERVFLYEDEKPVSVRDALHWARRGAASGNAYAHARLGACMESIDRDRDLLGASLELGPFWLDEAYFWVQSAIEHSLLKEALRSRNELGFSSQSSDVKNNRHDLEYYKWHRLWQLKAGFQASRHFGDTDDFLESSSGASSEYIDHLKKEGSLTPQQINQAEKELGEWLRARPNLWQDIYDNNYVQEYSEAQGLCPGEPGHREAYNFDWLSKKLGRYGVNITVPPDLNAQEPT